MKTLYNVGMYGGKFMPLHKGHLYCIDTAANECNLVYVLLFYGGNDEIEINSDQEYLSLSSRLHQLYLVSKKYDNVIVKCIDVSDCKLEDGSEDWDAETPLVLNTMGKMDVVYSSEPSYDEYFKRAYPWAKHRLVDPPRIHYPISGTAIRQMDEMERSDWII